MDQKLKEPWFATQTAHWCIVVAVTVAGTAWLHHTGAKFVWNNPIGYLISPFLIFGMLLGELSGIIATTGWQRCSISLALSIGFLTVVFAVNQLFRLPLANDLFMLTYFILRRRFLTPITAPWRRPEMWMAVLMFSFMVCVKITMMPRPIHMVIGILAGVLLFRSNRLIRDAKNHAETKTVQQMYTDA